MKDLLVRTITLLLSAALFVAAFLFSMVFFAIALAAGLVFLGFFLWKTRHLRRQMRGEFAQARQHGQRDVIEGTVIRSSEDEVRKE